MTVLFKTEDRGATYKAVYKEAYHNNYIKFIAKGDGWREEVEVTATEALESVAMLIEEEPSEFDDENIETLLTALEGYVNQ